MRSWAGTADERVPTCSVVSVSIVSALLEDVVGNSKQDALV